MKKTKDTPVHWSRKKEQAAGYWQLKFTLGLFRFLPVVVLRLFAFPVGFFYFLFSVNGRTESKHFLTKAAAFAANPQTAKKCRSPMAPLRHIISFSLTIVEKLESWGGRYPFENLHFQDDDITDLIQRLEDGKGVLLIISHLGNAELLRGLAKFNRTGVSRKVPLTLIADMKVNANFTRMIKELNPESSLDIINAQEIGPHTAVMLKEKLAAGEMVTIAGDRTSPSETEKNLMIPFLGEEAPFSLGIFYLATLMNVPVYFLFALRRGELSIKPEYDMHVCKSTLSLDCSRKERFSRSSELARFFAEILENHCKNHPFQWYNFFDFWSKGV
jgi:predicted LPLAT superfamily acyltransferase